jgi:hypothetical protein
VASAIEGRAGRIYTYLLADVPDSELGDFETGGKADMDVTVPWYAGIVGAHLRQGRNRLCVLEDTCVSPSDPGFEDEDMRHLRIYQAEVYRVLSPDDRDPGVVQDVIRTAASSQTAPGFMTVAPSDWDPAGTTLGDSQMEALARGVRKVAVGAYDLEGWIVWEAEE